MYVFIYFLEKNLSSMWWKKVFSQWDEALVAIISVYFGEFFYYFISEFCIPT